MNDFQIINHFSNHYELTRYQLNKLIYRAVVLKPGFVTLFMVTKNLKRVGNCWIEGFFFFNFVTKQAQNKGILAPKKVARFLEGRRIFKSNCDAYQLKKFENPCCRVCKILERTFMSILRQLNPILCNLRRLYGCQTSINWLS